jgi:hypothetical protein
VIYKPRQQSSTTDERLATAGTTMVLVVLGLALGLLATQFA